MCWSWNWRNNYGSWTGFKKVNKNCDIILADPVGSILEPKINTGKIPDKVGSWIVEGIGEDYIPPLLDLELISHAYAISDKEALQTCNILLQKEGFYLAVLVELLSRQLLNIAGSNLNKKML